MRAVEQGYRAALGSFADGSPLGGTVELGKVSAPKFVPFLRIMTEPLPQFGAGPGIFQPGIDVQRFLFHATRPEPLNQITYSIIRSFFFIDSLEFDHLSKPSQKLSSGNPHAVMLQPARSSRFRITGHD